MESIKPKEPPAGVVVTWDESETKRFVNIDCDVIECLRCNHSFEVPRLKGAKCPKCGLQQFWQDAGYGIEDDELRSMLSPMRPIPVSERLPEGDEEVQVYFDNNWWHGWRAGSWMYRADSGAELPCDPTHWLPLPPKPE